MCKQEVTYRPVLYTKSYKDLIEQLLVSLHLDRPVTLLDGDFSPEEISDMGISSDLLHSKQIIRNDLPIDHLPTFF